MSDDDRRISDDDRRKPKRMRESHDFFKAKRLPKRVEKEIPSLPAEDHLKLTLFTSEQPPLPPQSLPPLYPPPPHPLQLSSSHPLFAAAPVADYIQPPQIQKVFQIPQPRRNRRNTTQVPKQGKCLTIPPPFPWATDRRAIVHRYDYLTEEKQIFTITGRVQCKRCDQDYDLEFNLVEKFQKVWNFIAENKMSMRDRAPSVWMTPVLPTCKLCHQENSVKPIIADKKKSINWLFLLLGQMLGCCTLEQLKYFCKHTKNHRTGAKDRVLYLTYLGLCKQLDPSGPFDR